MNTSIKYYVNYLAVLLLLLSAVVGAAQLANPKERIDYWRNNYQSLNSADDNRVNTAHEIFNRVLRAAGSRNGIHPRLHILAKDPLNITLPISIPDGWVIISKGVLDLCFEGKKNGEDKLAFVLAHEIAHLIDDDFWHINFFNALDMSRQKGLLNPSVLAEIADIVGETDKVAKKELRADEKGVIITSMAGYDVNAIVSADGSRNFFKKWEGLLSVSRLPRPVLGNVNKDSLHPTSEQRSVNVLTRLQQIAENAELFRLGLLFYQSGKFDMAIHAFDEFLRLYPGREVYHNLAASHHQLALSYKKANKSTFADIPFKLPVFIDPNTRAFNGVYRGVELGDKLFKTNISAAINFYMKAVEQDPSYLIAYSNLASAYILNNQPFKAVAMLQDGMEIALNNARILNVLGVALYFTDNTKKAIEYLEKSITEDPNYSDPLFNLGKIAFKGNNLNEAKRHWLSYLKLDVSSFWADTLRNHYGIGKQVSHERGIEKNIHEKMLGIQVGNYSDEIPVKWGVSIKKLFPLLEVPHQMLKFKNGVTAIAEGDEIRLLIAEKSYSGNSKLGLKIGSTRSSVISTYGKPAMELKTSQGASMIFPEMGITFQMRNHHVVSWLVY
jgi:tetratricopeptide (TPR) repeat protein